MKCGKAGICKGVIMSKFVEVEKGTDLGRKCDIVINIDQIKYFSGDVVYFEVEPIFLTTKGRKTLEKYFKGKRRIKK